MRERENEKGPAVWITVLILEVQVLSDQGWLLGQNSKWWRATGLPPSIISGKLRSTHVSAALTQSIGCKLGPSHLSGPQFHEITAESEATSLRIRSVVCRFKFQSTQ